MLSIPINLTDEPALEVALIATALPAIALLGSELLLLRSARVKL